MTPTLPTPKPKRKTRTYQLMFVSRENPDQMGTDGVSPMIQNTPVDEFIDRKLDEGSELVSLRFMYAGIEELKFREIVPEPVEAAAPDA